MYLGVNEVIRRSDQGATRPFLIRADDDNLYFAKGRGAGRRDLICEFVGTSLAREFGLPVARHAILNVPEALIDIDRAGLRDLGVGPVFGSQHQTDVGDLLPSQTTLVPANVQRQLAVFDIWIGNADRTLSEQGGNPNLLWHQETKAVVVIDHNQAFDCECKVGDFMGQHVFRDRYAELAANPEARGELFARCRQALAVFDSACDNIPPEWWFIDDELTIPTPFDRDKVKLFLERFKEESFWSFT